MRETVCDVIAAEMEEAGLAVWLLTLTYPQVDVC
jgi:hypothetical protein